MPLNFLSRDESFSRSVEKRLDYGNDVLTRNWLQRNIRVLYKDPKKLEKKKVNLRLFIQREGGGRRAKRIR